MTTHPLCFQSPAEWQAYQEAARFTTKRVAGYCEDCLPTYQIAMVSEGRCSRPRIIFVQTTGGWAGSAMDRPDPTLPSKYRRTPEQQKRNNEKTRLRAAAKKREAKA